MLNFILGLFTGGTVGVFAMAILMMGKDDNA